MSLHKLAHLPDSARLWCFAADRTLEPSETAKLLDSVSGFLLDWTAHSRALRAGVDWWLHRVLLIAVDESETAASGCSIDALVGHLREIEARLGVSLVDSSSVWYRDERGAIRTASRAEFRALAAEGRLDEETMVIDLTLERLEQLRHGLLEVPAGRSWHRALLSRTGARTPG